MKSGLIVFGVCVGLAAVLGVTFYLNIREGLAQTQDIVTGLIYFMEEHAGRFPASEEEFLASSFVERLPGGAIRIHSPQGTRFRKATNGVTISGLQQFQIAWGTDLTALTLSEYGKAERPDGNTVELVSWKDSPPSGKGYTLVLLSAAQQCRPQPTSTASSQPSSPASSQP